MQWLRKGGRIDKACLIDLLDLTRDLMSREPNIVRLEGSKVAMVGDIHGQLYDMFHMLDLLEAKGQQEKIVFLGDYVDRGAYGPEVVAYLCAMKCTRPSDIVLLRGNHECREITTEFNFRA